METIGQNYYTGQQQQHTKNKLAKQLKRSLWYKLITVEKWHLGGEVLDISKLYYVHRSDEHLAGIVYSENFCHENQTFLKY